MPPHHSALRLGARRLRRPPRPRPRRLVVLGRRLSGSLFAVGVRLPQPAARDLRARPGSCLARPQSARSRHAPLPRAELGGSGDSASDVGRRGFAPPEPAAATGGGSAEPVSDHTSEDYAAMVDRARERMRVGDIFEVVLSQTYTAAYGGTASALFERLKQVNPSPFEVLIQFGGEQLVGTSPERFLRVEGDRVQSCPISGPARRGKNPMQDAENLKALMNSEKDEVELTMCTDVDRNDKSRICRPGTVKLLGRRLIETYAGLFHTVDHVEGRLRDGLCGIDAFLSHMWAVTLTGAPKKKAVEIVEEFEKGPRGWYGGAVGALVLSGDVNTGITIPTVPLRDGGARHRGRGTLGWESARLQEDGGVPTKATKLV